MVGLKKIISILILLLAAVPGLLSQNPRMSGYMGIWCSQGERTEYGYKLSGGFATFGSRHVPSAIFSPAVQKTFFVYGGTRSSDLSNLLIMISYYDHLTRRVPQPVIVFDKEGVRNPYDNATLSIDNSGYIWVFISGWLRTRPGIIFRSTRPYSIENFEQVLIKEMSFPQPWWSDEAGFLLTFSKIRDGLEINFSKSSDGISWSDDKPLVAIGGGGHITSFRNGKLYIAFNYHPGGDIDKRTNLYLIYTDNYGDTWKTINNKNVEIPVKNTDSEALIKDFRSENKLVYIYDINFDHNGNPVILICTGGSPLPGPHEIPYELTIVKRENGIWRFYEVCETDNFFDASALIIDGRRWVVAGPSSPGPQKYTVGGEMVAWESDDEGRTWYLKREITRGSSFNHSFPKRPVSANNDFYLWWSDGDPFRISESRIFFTNSRFNRVFMLPYSMNRESVRPLIVK